MNQVGLFYAGLSWNMEHVVALNRHAQADHDNALVFSRRLPVLFWRAGDNAREVKTGRQTKRPTTRPPEEVQGPASHLGRRGLAA